jgi:hypothetical protein
MSSAVHFIVMDLQLVSVHEQVGGLLEMFPTNKWWTGLVVVIVTKLILVQEVGLTS